jgi:hypothetical protein
VTATQLEHRVVWAILVVVVLVFAAAVVAANGFL